MDVDDIMVPINAWAKHHLTRQVVDAMIQKRTTRESRGVHTNQLPTRVSSMSLEDFEKKVLAQLELDLKRGVKRIVIDLSKLREKFDVPEENANSPSRLVPSSGVIFTSSYRNNTGFPQEHNFMMERKTETRLTTSLTKGYSKNGEVGFHLRVPDWVSEKTGAFGNEVTIQSDEEKSKTHSLTWAINTKVKVPKGETISAELKISEQTAHFRFKTSVRMKGKILARLEDVTTGHMFEGGMWEGGIAVILHDKKYNGGYRPKKDVAKIDLDNKEVIWNIEGDLTFRFGVSQEVEVK